MLFLQLTFTLLFPLLIGLSAINLLIPGKEDLNWGERLAYGYCTGAALLTAVMAFILPVFNIRYSIPAISLPFIPVILWGLFSSIKNQLLSIGQNLSSLGKNLIRSSAIEKFLFLLIFVQVLMVFVSMMVKPVVGVDAWTTYSLRAKAYFIEGTTEIKTITQTGRGNHNSLLQTWAFINMGGWNDQWGKLPLPFYFPALLTIFYFAAGRKRSRLIALFCTYVLSTFPFLFSHATLEYCDFMLAVYLFAGVVMFLRWLEEPKVGFLLLAALILGLTPTIKNEAYLHLSVIGLVFLANVYSARFSSLRYIKPLRLLTAAAFFLGAAFFINKAIGIREINLLPAATYLSRAIPLISVFLEYMFIRANWGLFFFLLLLAIIFNFRSLKDHLPLLSLVALDFLAFLLFYLTASEDVYSWLFYVTPAVRNMLQFMPLAVLLFAFIFTLEKPVSAPAPNPLPHKKRAR